MRKSRLSEVQHHDYIDLFFQAYVKIASFQSLCFNHYTLEGALFNLVFLCLFWSYLQCLDWSSHSASNSIYVFSDFKTSFTFQSLFLTDAKENGGHRQR